MYIKLSKCLYSRLYYLLLRTSLTFAPTGVLAVWWRFNYLSPKRFQKPLYLPINRFKSSFSPKKLNRHVLYFIIL